MRTPSLPQVTRAIPVQKNAVLKTEDEQRHGTGVYAALRQVFAVPRLGRVHRHHTGELRTSARAPGDVSQSPSCCLLDGGVEFLDWLC